MIHIRNAHEGEVDVLTTVGLRAWQSAIATIGETAPRLDSAESAFSQFIRQSWLTISVVEKDGLVAGWAAREALDENISDFWIDPDYRRTGLGAALLGRIEKDIVAQGFDTAALQSHSGNTEAIGFFKAKGYAIHWLSVAYSPQLDRDVPTVGLSKPLGEGKDGAYGPSV
jgi:ribosomal-protein-alanine N-acetyltransferase